MESVESSLESSYINNAKTRAMSKKEVHFLVELIRNTPVIYSKMTNATTNKAKEEAWMNVTNTFNAVFYTLPRTREQLKMKWDNLKKAARKRSQIQLDCLKTGRAQPDFNPADELLEKVASVLDEVPISADRAECPSLNILRSDDKDTENYEQECEIIDDIFTTGNPGDNFSAATKQPIIKGVHMEKKLISGAVSNSGTDNTPSPSNHKLITKAKKKKLVRNTGTLARNMAIAEYYKKKTEKLDLEIKLLKIELSKSIC